MTIFTNPWLLIALIAVCVLHILANFLPGILAKIVNYVNIGLHIASLGLLMWQRCNVDESLLFFMISIFVYTLVAFVYYEVSKCMKTGKEEEV